MKINGIDFNKIQNINKSIDNEKLTIDGKGFTDYLIKALDKVSDSEKEAVRLNELLAIGEIDNLHDVSIASEKASLTLAFAIEVRNKVLEAYNEINRMQF